MNLDLKNKNAMICGATAGIGKATAMQLAAMGASITLVARNKQKLKATLALLPSQDNQTHSYLVADFTNPAQLKEQVTAAVSKTNYHILLNNTGGPKGGPIFSADTSEFINAFSMHLECNQILVQGLVPAMKQDGYGRIINVISTSVKQPIDGLGVSNTVRGAVASWSK
jgi:3-oxoacyl-[acyl-carrier protein] reductase